MACSRSLCWIEAIPLIGFELACSRYQFLIAVEFKQLPV